MSHELTESSRTKTVFLIGSQLTNEGITTKLKSLGHSYEVRNPFSSPFNWVKIEKDLNRENNSQDLLAAFLHLTEGTLFRCCSPEYQEVLHGLLMEMKRTAALIFIYEDNLLGKFSSIEEDEERLSNRLNLYMREGSPVFLQFQKEGALNALENIKANIAEIELGVEHAQSEGAKPESFHGKIETVRDLALLFLRWAQTEELEEPLIQAAQKELAKAERVLEKVDSLIKEQRNEEAERAKRLIKDILASGIEVVPYRKNVEIAVRIQQFLDEEENGIFLHLYVPNGRYQADQLASFLQLFESYLQRVEKLHFAVDRRRTHHGLVYVFKSKDDIVDIIKMEEAFTRFEDFMGLCQNDHKKAEAVLISTGLASIEATNLISRYIKNYQRLLLDTRHELQQKTLTLQQRLESEAFELTNGNVSSLPQMVQPYALLSLSSNSGLININISNPLINDNSITQSVIEQTMNGDIYYTPEDKQLIDLFQRYTENLEAISLKSELEQLKDKSSPEEVRKTAKQKVLGFLYKVAPAIGQSALNVLTAYLQKVLTGT